MSEGANGWFKSDAVGKESQNYLSSPQYWFYQSAEMIDHDQKPYAETRFEPSPLNRVVKQGAPGEEWGPDPDDSYNSDDHTIKFSYGTNEADEVFLWTYTRPQSQALGLIDAFDGTSPVYYDEDQLYKNKTKDEQGNEVIEFVDKFGKVVLKKVEAPDGNWAETYYVYDDFGNLVTVLPPQATDGLVVDYFGEQSADQQQFLSRWAFRYTYDDRNRMIQKQVPGAEPVFMVYDNRDRLVLTQDGNQRLTNQWAFTKYDALNRSVLTGLFTDNTHIGQEAMQTEVDNFYNTNPEKFFEVRGSIVHGYTNGIVSQYSDRRGRLPDRDVL